jgi:hypothetical protein
MEVVDDVVIEDLRTARRDVTAGVVVRSAGAGLAGEAAAKVDAIGVPDPVRVGLILYKTDRAEGLHFGSG